MKLKKLLEGIEVKSANCSLDMEIDSICYDSRCAFPGTAFVAARRVGADGHDYIENAIEEGTSLVVSERPVDSVNNIVVEDGNKALAIMSANMYGRPAEKLKMIGVTGTKGKTTVSYFIKSILEKCTGKKVGLIGTIQNMIGDEILEARNSTPEAPELHKLLGRMYDSGCEYAVMEVSSHSLAIDRVYGIEYEIAIFNNLSQDHLDYHKTMEAYLEAKTKLFSMCKIGVINIDDPASEQVIAKTTGKKYTFSINRNEADLQAKNIRFLEDQGCSFEALTDMGIGRIYLSTPGIFTVYNALSAIGCCVNLGIPLSEISKALKDTEPVRGRVEVIPTNTDYKVIVDYAHSPASVENVLTAVRDFTPGRIISIIGCGGNRDKTKRPLMAEAAAKASEYVILTTDNPRNEEPKAIINDMLPGLKGIKTPHEVIVDRAEAIRHALDIAKKGDTVLIMGKGHETYQEIKGVRSHFDDREEVLKYYVVKQGKKKLV